MENGPFEDVSPIKSGGFHCYVSLPEGNMFIFTQNPGEVIQFDEHIS